ncbi:putative uncharacterized aarF domain-containing protein kinase 1 [Apostichopus japonicus]|uniref:Uncharacterized aarF domain-containing protein kinase 1 n=1 Tax=Stichopus japonicus TaxID=307972 RepID=A0A2G8LMI3_STIJA|nr:putative uncharacterized aarF domain-containing protein kinase 1 [Apostichopus japonicus]
MYFLKIVIHEVNNFFRVPGYPTGNGSRVPGSRFLDPYHSFGVPAQRFDASFLLGYDLWYYAIFQNGCAHVVCLIALLIIRLTPKSSMAIGRALKVIWGGSKLRRAAIVTAAASVGTYGFYNVNSRYQLIDWSSIGVVRFGRAFFTAASIVGDYKTSLLWVDSSDPDSSQIYSKIHLRSAEKLKQLACLNGGVFIKVGQHIGALDYLLPSEYVSTLKVLHDNAPQSSLEDVKRVVEEDLNCKVDEAFSSFDEEPIGTASLAQVHKATLKDGRDVAIKVQHPKVKDYSDVDMNTIEFLLQVVARIFPEFKFLWLSEEMRFNLPKELDFVLEGQNSEKVYQLLKHFKFLKVPKVYWEYSTKRVLCMEYYSGGKVDDRQYMVTNGIDANEVTQSLGKMYSEMIFVHGYVHCDPHPGNVLVRNTGKKDVEIVLLDHGLYQALSDKFRLNYARLWQSILAADIKGIKQYSDVLGAGEMYGLFACMLTARSWESVSKGIDKKDLSQSEAEEIQDYVSSYIPEISQLLNKIPRQMLLLLKTNDLLRSIEFTLKSRKSSSSFLNMSRCCVRAVTDHELRTSKSLRQTVNIHFQRHLTLLKINLYEFYLWLITAPALMHLTGIFLGGTQNDAS